MNAASRPVATTGRRRRRWRPQSSTDGVPLRRRRRACGAAHSLRPPEVWAAPLGARIEYSVHYRDSDRRARDDQEQLAEQQAEPRKASFMSSPGIAPPPWTGEPSARATCSCASRCVNPQPVGGVCGDLQGFRCGFGECGARMGHRTAAQETIAALPLRPARPSAGEPARRRRRALRGVAGAPSPGRRRAGDAGGRGRRHRGSRGRGPKPRHAGGNHGHRRDRCRRRGALSGRTAPRPRAGARGTHVPRCASSFARS